MRGQAIAGLARTPRGSLIVLKLEKTCQTICHIYISIYELYSIYTGCHTHTTNLFCFVMSFSWLNAFKCSARSLPLSLSHTYSLSPGSPKWKPAKPKPKTEPNPNRTRHRQPKYVLYISAVAVAAAVAVAVDVAAANYMLTRTRKLITHLAQNLKSRESSERIGRAKKKRFLARYSRYLQTACSIR